MEETDFSIFPPHEAFYITSLYFCTESALRSATLVSELIKERTNPDFSVHHTLNELQNIANQGAAISRFFWPSKNYRKRGKALRAAFSIHEDCALKDRTLRNMVEHFDEYLDDFLGQFFAGTFIPDYFGPKPPEDIGPTKFFRAFFTNTGEFQIIGRTFELQPIVDEISSLHKKLVESEEKGGRFPTYHHQI